MTEDDMEKRIDDLIDGASHWALAYKNTRELKELFSLVREKSRFYGNIHEKLRRHLEKPEDAQKECERVEQIREENLSRDVSLVDEDEERIEKLKAAVEHYKRKSEALEIENNSLKSNLALKKMLFKA